MIPTSDFVARLKSIAREKKTVYAWGMFGSPISEENVDNKTKQYPAWYTKRSFRNLYGKNYWGFDCIGLIKGVLWGWNADVSKANGGAVYASNGVPDISADAMISKCSAVSSDFSSLSVGEFLWMKGHCGIYMGDGLAIESTPKWEGGVQITAVGNLGAKRGYNTRTWTKHGKLPYVSEEVTTVKIEMEVLRKGSEGEQVKVLQRLLIAQGYDLGACGADGVFGCKTDEAARWYQKSKGLVSDGVVGKNTWSKILGVN